tara:strand:+ start:714 stop:947 length:234 start_codon:yes stop_codon:yes gene_type:complete
MISDCGAIAQAPAKSTLCVVNDGAGPTVCQNGAAICGEKLRPRRRMTPRFERVLATYPGLYFFDASTIFNKILQLRF